LLLSLQAQAQAVELTLNCQYETALDAHSGKKQEVDGTFSATVILNERGDGAVIKATT
jgi:hypothetical protein